LQGAYRQEEPVRPRITDFAVYLEEHESRATGLAGAAYVS
jgi:hypothetical protein